MAFFGKLGKRQENTCETVLATSDLPQHAYQCLMDKDVIGEGGFAVVFTAKLPDNGKQIVVKKLLATNKEAKKSLVKEARLLSMLQHPNVVEFKGVCLTNLICYSNTFILTLRLLDNTPAYIV